MSLYWIRLSIQLDPYSLFRLGSAMALQGLRSVPSSSTWNYLTVDVRDWTSEPLHVKDAPLWSQVIGPSRLATAVHSSAGLPRHFLAADVGGWIRELLHANCCATTLPNLTQFADRGHLPSKQDTFLLQTGMYAILCAFTAHLTLRTTFTSSSAS